ncbi:inositol phosphate phosphatase SopB [Spongorhabdus nitratireducens]
MPGKIPGRHNPVESDRKPLIDQDTETKASIHATWGVKLTRATRHMAEGTKSVNRLASMSSEFLRRSLSRFRSIQGYQRYAPNTGSVSEQDITHQLNRFLRQHRDCSLEQLPPCEQQALRDNLLLMLDWARSKEFDYTLNECAERAVTEFVSPIQQLAPKTTELMSRPPARQPTSLARKDSISVTRSLPAMALSTSAPSSGLKSATRVEPSVTVTTPPVHLKATTFVDSGPQMSELKIPSVTHKSEAGILPIKTPLPVEQEYSPAMASVAAKLKSLPKGDSPERKVRVFTSREKYYQATEKTAELLTRSPYKTAAQGWDYAGQAEELRYHASLLDRFLSVKGWAETLPDPEQVKNLQDDIWHQQRQLEAAASHLDLLHEGDFRNEGNWRKGHQVELESVLLAISWELDRLARKPRPLSERKQTLIKSLKLLEHSVNEQIRVLPVTEPAGGREQMTRELKNYQKFMVRELKASGMDKSTAKQLMNDARRVVVTELPWDVIHKTVPVSGGGKTVLMEVIQTPASKMRYINGAPGHHTPFASGYSRMPFTGGADIGGVSSLVKDEAYHAVNLWTMDIRDEDGKLQFQGVRSGTLCAYGIKDKSDRREANRRRAREIITAALLQQFAKKPELARAAEAGQRVQLKLLSNALLSPDMLRHLTHIHDDELTMLKEQIRAFEEVVQEGLPIMLRDASGGIHPVNVDVKLATFNLGVNGLAQGIGGWLGKLDGSWMQSNRYNRNGLKVLLGQMIPGSAVGGWAGDWLQQNPDHPDADIVRQLVRQVREIWHSKAYQKEGTDAYKMVDRLLYLAWLIDAMPHWSCKSGKDRTGEAAGSIGWLASEIALHGRVPDWQLPLTREQQTNAQGMVVEGGHMEVTQNNTGRPHLKTGSGKKRFGTDVFKMTHD